MLLWEALEQPQPEADSTPVGEASPARVVRLPYDRRCAALTKSGRRCKGKSRDGKEYCIFHDPEIAAKRQAAMMSGRRKRSRLSRLPDGYLRKLKDRSAVGQAMDRLYREVRLGIVTAEMGRVLFNILTRLADSELEHMGVEPRRSTRLLKLDRVRPKLHSLLTRKERTAWKLAVEKAEHRGEARDRRGTGAASKAGHTAPTSDELVRGARLPAGVNTAS